MLQTLRFFRQAVTMRRFLLFMAVVIVFSSPCILGGPPPPPPPDPPKIVDVNPEASKDAKGLLNELWPDFEEAVAKYPILADQYNRILQTFEEAALQSDGVAKTRVGKALLEAFSGNGAMYTRDDITKLLRIEYGMTDVDTVAMTASNLIEDDPEITDEGVELEIKGLLSLLGLKVEGAISAAVEGIRGQLISAFMMMLITQRKGKM